MKKVSFTFTTLMVFVVFVFNGCNSGGSETNSQDDHPQGNFVWVCKGGGSLYDTGCAIAVDSNNNLYAAGFFEGSAVSGHFKTNTTFENTSFTAYGQYDIFIARYDSNGNLIWVKQAGGDDYDEGCSITLGNDNSIYVTGAYKSYYQPARFDGFH